MNHVVFQKISVFSLSHEIAVSKTANNVFLKIKIIFFFQTPWKQKRGFARNRIFEYNDSFDNNTTLIALEPTLKHPRLATIFSSFMNSLKVKKKKIIISKLYI